MDIKQDEIKETKKIGVLHNSEVKLISLKGGFHIGVGKKSANSQNSDILAVGSHPAIVSHQISKKYNGKFEEKMAKNEEGSSSTVSEYSHNLNSTQKNVLGLDIYAVKKNEQVEFKITKHNFEIFSIKASELAGEIVLEKSERNEARLRNIDKKELGKNLEKSIREYANSNSLKIKKDF